MAQVKISELPSASSLTGSEVLPVVQGGSTLGATVNQIKDKIQASTINVLKMNASSVQTLANIGELAFNPDAQTLEVKCSADVTLSIGQENYIRGKNAEADTILNGTVIYVSGGLGANSLIKRAGNADGTAERVIGVATQDIAANNIGFVTTSGIVNKLDTSSYAEGDLLWLGTNGAMTNVKPDTSVDQICIGVVLRSHANEGSILVAVKDDWRDKLAEVRSDLNETTDKLTELEIELESDINGNSQVVITPNAGSNMVAKIDVKQGDVISVSAIASDPLTYSSYITLYMGDENIYRSIIIRPNNTTGSIAPYAVENSGMVKVIFEYNEYAQNSIIFTIEPSKKGIIGSISEINDRLDSSNSLWDKLTTPEIKDTIRTLNIKKSSYDSRITGIYLLSVGNVLHLAARIPGEYLWNATIQMSDISANNIVYDLKVISTKIPSISIGEVVAQIVFADYETLLENITSGLDNSINVLVAMIEITSTNITGIDDVPTVNSANVVSSNGVAKAINNINIDGLKTDFLQLDENSNIIDKAKCVEHFLVAGGSNGSLKEFPTNDFWATDFIPLKSETQYFFDKVEVGWFCFYDEHKNRIYGVNTADSITELQNPFTTPEGTAYGRFSFASTSNKNVGWLSRSAYPNEEYGYISNGKLKISQNEVLKTLYRKTTDKLPVLTKSPLEVIRFDYGVVPMIRTWGVIGASRNSGELAGYEVGSSSISRVDDYQYSRLQQMCRLCGSEGYNFSVGGQTVKWWMLDTTSQRGFAYASMPENLKQAYIIDLGGNDVAHLDIYSMGLGSVADVDIYDYENNADSFAGWYGKLIQKMKEINPYARFFCETQPYNEQTYGAINQVIRDVAALFDNVYLMDMARYNPFSNYSALQRLNDHGSPLGYLYNAYEEMNYIDWIIRNNYSDFSDICFIGTTKRAFINYSISGNIVNGSKARISLVNDNCQFYTTGNDSGQYEIIGIKPGIYQLTIAKSGYTSYTESIEVVNQNISKNITL